MNYCYGNGKAFADRERIRIGRTKAAGVCRRGKRYKNVENLRRKEGGKRKRKKKNVDNWKRKEKKSAGS